MENQNMVNGAESVENLTLGEIESGANEALKHLMEYPSWGRLSAETQRALYYYQAYCDGAAGGVSKARRVTLDITGLSPKAERVDIYKRGWLDGWRYALDDIKRGVKNIIEAQTSGDAVGEAVIMADCVDNPAPIKIPDWI